jgi:carboxyl-terminal processing protease
MEYVTMKPFLEAIHAFSRIRNTRFGLPKSRASQPQRRREFSRALLMIACLIAALLHVGFAQGQDADKKDDDYYELMKTFAETFEQIERNYVTDINRRELMEAAIQGMLQKLDRYSNYIGPQELEAFTESMDQEFGGIGVQVDLDRQTGRLIVVSPLPGTPAFKAGLKAGDLIMEIEGQSTEGFTVRDAQKLLKGRPGDSVSVGILHKGDEEIITVQIVRALIKMNTVLGDRYAGDAEWEYMLDSEHKIGFIRLTHFSNRSSEELRNAIKKLKEQGVRGLILDLRFNPGGLLSQAVEIADLFLEEGTIVSTKGRNSPERSWKATKAGTIADLPLAVLVNRYSASASEIVSASLQDHERAVVIGERTWGKGSVQNVIPLDGEHSMLKLTTASYHRPSGKNIHRNTGAKPEDDWGVMPNDEFEYKMSDQEIRDYFEFRRQRDILDESGPPQSEFEDPHIKLAVSHLIETISGSSGDSKPDESKSEDSDSPQSTGKTEASPGPTGK